MFNSNILAVAWYAMKNMAHFRSHWQDGALLTVLMKPSVRRRSPDLPRPLLPRHSWARSRGCPPSHRGEQKRDKRPPSGPCSSASVCTERSPAAELHTQTHTRMRKKTTSQHYSMMTLALLCLIVTIKLKLIRSMEPDRRSGNTIFKFNCFLGAN